MGRYLALFIGASITVVLDQASKIWAAGALSLPNGELPADSAFIRTRVQVVFESWFNFRLAGNKGAAWGIFNTLDDAWRVPFFVVISLIAVGVVLYLFHQAKGQRILGWALPFILGGAIGNLIDRVRLGYVVDFIDWFYGDYHWPTFNVADAAICLGVGLLILDMFVNRKDDPESELISEP